MIAQNTVTDTLNRSREGLDPMDYKVFIHSNHKQMVGALVGQYALTRNSHHADAFSVEIIDTKDYEFLRKRNGQPYQRDGGTRVWDFEDLQ